MPDTYPPTEVIFEIDGVDHLAKLHETLISRGVDILETSCLTSEAAPRGRVVTRAPADCQAALADLGVEARQRSKPPNRDRRPRERLDAHARRFAEGAEELTRQVQHGLEPEA